VYKQLAVCVSFEKIVYICQQQTQNQTLVILAKDSINLVATAHTPSVG
jgi:hypothetical protein